MNDIAFYMPLFFCFQNSLAVTIYKFVWACTTLAIAVTYAMSGTDIGT